MAMPSGDVSLLGGPEMVIAGDAFVVVQLGLQGNSEEPLL